MALERNVWVLGVTTGVLGLLFYAWQFFFAIYITTPITQGGLGASALELGLVIMIQSLVYVIVILPFGYIADIIGRKKIIIFGTALVGVCYAGYGLVPSWEWIIIPAIGAAFASAAFIGALQALLYDSVPPDKRATASASMSLIAGIFLWPGPLLGALWFSTFNSWRSLFILTGIVYAIVAVFRLFLLKETMARNNRIQELNFKNFIINIGKNSKTIVFGLKTRFWFFVSASIGSFATALTWPYFFVLYAFDIIKLSEMEIGIWQTVIMAATILVGFPLGVTADIWSRRKMIIIANVVYFFSVIFIFCQNLIQVLLASIPIIVASAISMTVHDAFLSNLIEKEKRALAMSISYFINNLAIFSGPFIGAIFYSSISSQSPFILCLILSIIALIPFLIWVYEPEELPK
jgi:MFS family permease